MEDIVTFQGNIEELVDRDVYSSDGHRIGSVGQIFVQEGTDEPTWLTVQTGLFGMHETFVPVAEVTRHGDELHVPYEKSFVKDAPRIDSASELTAEQEAELYRYYGVQPPMRQQAGQTDAGAGHGADHQHGDNTGGHDAGHSHDEHTDGHDASHSHDDDSHSDHSQDDRPQGLHAGTRGGEISGPRLRRRIVTEMQTIQVPVQREEIVVEGDGIDSTPDDERR